MANDIRQSMQAFVDQGTTAGVVTLVASAEKVLSVEAVGYADLGEGEGTGEAMRPDSHLLDRLDQQADDGDRP